MQDLADWLEELGMSEYTQSFVGNGIDFAVLPDLTDQDLKDIGVLLGHRRKLLRAIAELTGRGERFPKAAVRDCTVRRATRRCRAPPSHCAVLGPRRLDGALCAHGP